MDQKRDLIMSINVPFCPKICDFCDKGYLSSEKSTRDAYTKAVLRELDSVSDELDDYKLRCLHLGGGVPTYLAEMQLPQLVRAVVNRVELADDFVIDLKTAPGCIGINVLSKIKDCGPLRMEFDLCTSHPFESEVLGRKYSEGDMAVSRTILEYGKTKDLGVDLMYGLPGQNQSTVRSSLETAQYFAPTSVALLPLRVTRGTKFYQRVVVEHGRSIELTHHRSLPTREEKLACFAAADEILKADGFEPYTAWHYAQLGREGLYHRLLQSDIDRIGLGVGGISLDSDCFMRNTSDLDRYLKGAGDPSIVLDKAELADSATRMRLFVRGGLFKIEGLNLAECRERYGQEPDRAVWGPLIEEGLVEPFSDGVNGEMMRLTLEGRCFADEVIDRVQPLEDL